MRYSTLIASAVAAGLASAHGDVNHGIAVRKEMLKQMTRSVGDCAAQMMERGIEARSIQRRAAKREELIKKRGIKPKSKRDLLDDVLATDHNRSSTGYTMDTSEATIFASWSSCLLTSEGESGPYYVAGEYARTDLVDDQEGVPVHYEFQIIDVETCEPLVGKYFEIFNANSTGVYSGTTNTGNGNTDDTSVLDETFLRGLQATDDEGVASFDTLFPGHYSGRATHVHTILHTNATERENGTVFDLTASHIGQAFWDQSVRDEIETLYPYSTNTNDVTANVDDNVIIAETETQTSSDPFFNFVQLGEDISDGFLAWIVFGVNTSATTYTLSPAAILYESGGVEEESTDFGDSQGSGGPSGSEGPSGFAEPTGF